MTHVRCHLKEIFLIWHLRQDQFADAMGCEQSQVSKWMNSQQYPTIGTVLDILATLDRLTGKTWDVRDVWRPANDRVFLPNSMARHNAETVRVSKIAAKVRNRWLA